MTMKVNNMGASLLRNGTRRTPRGTWLLIGQMERKSMTTIADNRTFTTATAVDASHPQHEQVRVLVSELLGGGREAILEHHGQEYRLRITQNGKLILTK